VKSWILRIAECGPIPGSAFRIPQSQIRTPQFAVRNPQSGIRNTAWLFVVASLLMGPITGAQSLTFSKGQNVAPAYEGWEQGADGAKYFLFGYMNRNWEEEIDVPVGPDNGFNLGGADQGQPTHFLPRRNRFVFRVRVPKDFTEKDELVWTLTTHGKTEKAYATLRPDYIVDDVVKASETGALGAGTSSPEVRSNKPPDVRIEEVKARNVKVGEWLTLVAEVKDDGIPKPRDPSRVAAAQARIAAQTTAAPAGPPRNPALSPPTRITVGKNLGLHVSWFVYRGPGKATFDPPQVKAWEDTRAGANSPWAPLWAAPKLPEDGKLPVHVAFDTPGTYVLRCVADDGALTSGEDVTIVVVP
jgi:autonomous glycyl radical cofactor GrcA